METVNASDSSNIQVVIRIRPPSDASDRPESGEVLTVSPDRPNLITVRDPLSRGNSENAFQYNKILLPDCSQTDVFESVSKSMVDKLVDGYNSCIFAYGQTGSGKTYTMFGEGLSGRGEKRGLIPHSVDYLFERLQERSNDKEHGLVVSFLEVYFDQIRDLGRAYMAAKASKAEDAGSASKSAVPSVRSGANRPASAALDGRRPGKPKPGFASDSHRPRSASGFFGNRPSMAGPEGSGDMLEDWESTNLEIHEAPNGQVFVRDQCMIPIRSISDVIDVVEKGSALRAVYETAMNPVSSRSHTIFSITLTSRDKHNIDAETVTATMNFIDLAGSERLAHSKAEGRRFQEAVIINSSLSALSKVILTLSQQDTRLVRHVPYRDSKLTRILQNALGGNSYTTVIATINPIASAYTESLSTLYFAHNCRNVVNKPTINFTDTSKLAVHERTIQRLLQENRQLKHQLELARSSSAAKEAILNQSLQDRLKGQQGVDPLGEEKGKEDSGPGGAMSLTEKNELENRIREMKSRIDYLENKLREKDLMIAEMQREGMKKEEEYRKRILILEEKLKLLQAEFDDARNQIETEASDKIQEMENRMREVEEELQKGLNESNGHRVSALIQKIHLWLEERNSAMKNKISSVEFQRMKELKSQKSLFVESMSLKEYEWKQQVDNKQHEIDKLTAGFSGYKTRKKEECEQYKKELVSMFKLNSRLMGLVEDIENGRFSTTYRSGLKRVAIPGTLKESGLPRSKDFPQLFQVTRNASKILSTIPQP